MALDAILPDRLRRGRLCPHLLFPARDVARRDPTRQRMQGEGQEVHYSQVQPAEQCGVVEMAKRGM